jgi:small basic protein (TIGR04137 family)
MSVDKSLKIRNRMQRSRNVLTRAERIERLRDEGKFDEDQSIFGLPKVRVFHVGRRAAKAKEEAPAEESAAGEAAAEES